MNFQIYASASCCDWTSRPLVSSNMVSLSYTVLGEGWGVLGDQAIRLSGLSGFRAIGSRLGALSIEY